MSADSMKDSCGTRNSKPTKSFCSLAYLAKSTIAINGSCDIRNANKNNTNDKGNCQSTTPNVAATAKVNDRGSPSLPTGAATTVNGHSQQQQQQHLGSLQSSTTGNIDTQSQQSSVCDVFGVINEEGCDQIDGELRRPWEIKTGPLERRIPASLMPAQPNANGAVGLPSLSKFNSLDCWDYTIELECLKGPQGKYSTIFQTRTQVHNHFCTSIKFVVDNFHTCSWVAFISTFGEEIRLRNFLGA